LRPAVEMPLSPLMSTATARGGSRLPVMVKPFRRSAMPAAPNAKHGVH
jgi:hypothetical protein